MFPNRGDLRVATDDTARVYDGLCIWIQPHHEKVSIATEGVEWYWVHVRRSNNITRCSGPYNTLKPACTGASKEHGKINLVHLALVLLLALFTNGDGLRIANPNIRRDRTT